MSTFEANVPGPPASGGSRGGSAGPPDDPEPPADDRGRQEPLARTLVPRWLQLVLVPIALLATWVVVRAASKVVLMFIIAALIALILNPAVAFLQRSGVRRGLAVLAVYLGFFVTAVAIGYLLAHPIASQAQKFAHNVPHIVDKANSELAEVQRSLDRAGFHVQFESQGKTALQTLEDKVVKSSTRIAEFGGQVLTEAASALFDVVVVFVLSVYMLVYGERIGRLVRAMMPGGSEGQASTHRNEDFPTLVQRALTRYVGGQLLFSVLMGTTTGVGLYIFGVVGIFPDGRKFALAFGTFYALMELVPYLGPFLGAAPAVLVALFTKPITALWVTLLFVVLQQLEGHVVAPQIFGRTLRINPLLVLFALLFGLEVRGVVGALVALPVLSVVRETVVYLRRHLALEAWDKAPGPLL
jgi:predicted PurR-regulated permease PerM